MLKAIAFLPTQGWTDVDDLTNISNLCDESGVRLWAETDVRELSDTDVRTIAEEFGLHPLAVEDARSERERPKVEEYDKHLFAVVHELQAQNGQLEPAQIACFIGARYVLALHAGAERTLAEVRKRLQAQKAPLAGGSASLMHVLLDTIVDDYESIADELENEVEEMEERLLADPRSESATRLYIVKQRVARFRRYVLPVSRMLATVVEQGSLGSNVRLVDEHFGTYFRDVLDHSLRVADQIRSVEELANALVDLVRVEASNSQNEVTKRLTGWAAIIAVPTYIASVYGMNYRLVPEHETFGFFFALGLMATTAVFLFVYFKRKSWI
jgi:magnesium transporter